MKIKDKPKSKKKYPPYTRWYDKIPINKEMERLKQQCNDMGITNIIW